MGDAVHVAGCAWWRHEPCTCGAEHETSAFGTGAQETPPDVLDDAYESRLDDEREIAAELRRLRVRTEARRRFDAETIEDAPPFDAGLLAEILARPAEPPHRIDGFLPTGGRLLVVAQRKTGKTTLLLNLALSFIDGGMFLGRFPTRATGGNIAILNFEVTAATLARWAQEVGIPGDRLLLVNLRGRRNPLMIDEDREHLVKLLADHSIDTLIVDPFGRAYTGKSQNDAGEVTAWLVALDQLAADAGVSELVLAAHAGWDGERSRGSTALEDWADVVTTMVRDPEDEKLRYIRAFGRDVEVDEDRLVFEADTRTLTLAGSGSRRKARRAAAVDEMRPKVLDYLAENPGASGSDIRGGIDGTNGIIDAARMALVADGEVVEEPRRGRGGGKAYRIADPNPANPAETPPTAGYGTPPTPPYSGGVPTAELEDEVRRASGDAA